MPKQIVTGELFRRRIQSGVDQIANAVRITLGPRGRNVVIRSTSGILVVLNDGATIAREFELAGRVENIGASLMREVAQKTYDTAGDGTTTATLLAQVIIAEGLKNIAVGANPMELKKGIQGAAQLAVAAIRKLASPVDSRQTIARVAAVSAGDAVIGDLIADALGKVGPEGVITVEESGGRETTLDVKLGMQFDRGYLSPEMVTDRARMTADLENPYILITDRKITETQELVPLLDQVAKQRRPLLIIADEVESRVLGMLAMNNRSGVIRVAAVHPPAYGDGRMARMDDLAVFTGATFITEKIGYVLEETTLDRLGGAASVRVDRKSTILIGGAGNRAALAGRIEELRLRIGNTEYDFDRNQLKERLAKLTGGVAAIHVGAITETELKEKKQRIENAVNAARSAAVEGIVPGGGVAYLHILPALKAYADTLSGDMKTGALIIHKALSSPARQIADNAGEDGGAVIAELRRLPAGVGFNALTCEYTNMLEAGIVDSARVARLAVQNAASVAAALLSIEAGVMDL